MEVISSNRFDLEQFPKGKITRFWLHIINNGLGEPIRIPILVARGTEPGPVLGLNAALHGNELNGINVIQKLFADLDAQRLKGSVIGILVANIPGVLLGQRRFNDDFDLNRQAPGNENGTPSSVYIFRLIDRVIRHFDYLIDLHTTGSGKQNCFHVRADMNEPVTARLARLQNAEIILHSEADTASLRGYCSSIGIRSLTQELRDPMLFQHDVIADSICGIQNVMIELGMTDGAMSLTNPHTLLCRRSRWTRSDEGGILMVLPQLLERVEEGQLMARIRDIFGEVRKEFRIPVSGVVVARNVNPICQTGMGIMNIGFEIEELPMLDRINNGEHL